MDLNASTHAHLIFLYAPGRFGGAGRFRGGVKRGVKCEVPDCFDKGSVPSDDHGANQYPYVDGTQIQAT
jgi:hypothetical protein